MSHHIKKLDKAGLTKLRSLESKLGCWVVALEKQPKLADMSVDQLKELQALEKELDATLLAYTG